MPRGKTLTDTEKGIILAFKEENISLREIAKRINRSLCVVQNFLNNPDTYGTTKRCGRKRKLDERTERQIVQAASNTTTSLRQLQAIPHENVSRSTVWRTLKRSKIIKYQKKEIAPKLTSVHKEKRLKFARNNVATNWNRVVFSDEKKWNLDGPDGSRGYYHDTRKEPLTFTKRNFGGGNIMTWAAFSAEGCLEIQFVSSRMKSRDYIEVLEKSLVPFLDSQDTNNWIFQQDNARIHVSKETKNWFAAKRIEIMEWPPCSPDLNPIENLWGILSQRVYKNNRQFNSVSEIMEAIKIEWKKIEPGVITNLISSMEHRLNDVFVKRGNFIG